MADTPDQFGDDERNGLEDESAQAPESADLEANEQDGEAEGESDEDIIERAKACLTQAEDAEGENRKLALEDTKFSIGEQWPLNIRQEREQDKRPCLVVNRIPGFIHQITNDQRQNRPAIRVHPVGDGADLETAKVIQGLIRHIEYNSNADVAYDTAFDHTARGGFGFWRVLTDFVSPDSFDQEIYIKRVPDQFSVFMDPRSQEPDGSDAEWALVLEYLTRDDYRDKYPDSKLASLSWESIGLQPPQWMRDGAACVAEFFYKSYEDHTLYLLKDGRSVLDTDLHAEAAQAAQAGVQIEVVKSRQTKVPVIKWCKLNPIEILERTDWPGKYIPVVPVYGDEIRVDGKRVLEGIVRNAKDPQRMLNFYKSAEAEAIALAPRAPFVGAEGQFEGHEAEWQTANTRNHAYLEYKATSVDGQMVPPPQRMAVEPAVGAISQGAMQAADDLKSATGIYDPTLGAGPADTSGVAIQKRNIQAQTANFHFIDNLTRALRHTGRILVDLIPRIYDTARTARIIGEDGTQKIITLNQSFNSDSGEQLLYKLDTGTYDVTVDVGPSFASKRQETAASMQELSRAYPQLMQYAGDLMVGSMDWNKAQEIADRLKRMLPPQLQDGPQGMGKIPPQVQAQLQQQQVQIQQLAKMYHSAQDELDQKKPEIESRERIEMAKLQTQATIELAKLDSKEGIALLEQEIGAIKHSHALMADQMQAMAAAQSNPQMQAPDSAGGIPAPGGDGGPSPTGGPSPGQPMEQ